MACLDFDVSDVLHKFCTHLPCIRWHFRNQNMCVFQAGRLAVPTKLCATFSNVPMRFMYAKNQFQCIKSNKYRWIMKIVCTNWRIELNRMLQISLGRVKRKKALLLFQIHYGMRTAFDISLSQHNFIIICCLQMKDVAACHNSAHRYRRFMQLGRVHRTNSISFIQLILF